MISSGTKDILIGTINTSFNKVLNHSGVHVICCKSHVHHLSYQKSWINWMQNNIPHYPKQERCNMDLWKIPVGLWKIPVSSPRNYCVNCCKKQKATFGPKDFEKLKTNSQSKDKCCQKYPKDLITRINWFLCFSCMRMTSSKRSNEALDACQLHAFWSVLRPVHNAVLLSDVGCWQNCCRGDETSSCLLKNFVMKGRKHDLRYWQFNVVELFSMTLVDPLYKRQAMKCLWKQIKASICKTNNTNKHTDTLHSQPILIVFDSF